MKVLVVGCGSIGRRRAEILLRMGHEVWVYDTGSFNAPPGTSVFSIGTDPHKLYAEVDAVLICTPPDETRVDIVDAVCRAQSVRGLFIEKPLALRADHVTRILELTDPLNLITMVACNMRFDSRLRWLAHKDVQAASAYMGQHSIYWSPGHRAVSLLLDSIHELDLLVHLMGEIRSLSGSSTPRFAEALTEHAEGGIGYVSLNRTQDPPQRFLRVMLPYGDMIHRVTLWPPDESMYEREMRHFMHCVDNAIATCNSIRSAANTHYFVAT